jgi:hypothetical protein
VSEEKNQTSQEQTNWEAQLQARANELLAQRTNALQAEIERLQASISEISSRLLEKAQAAPTEQETSSLLDYVKQWFSDSTAKAEGEFQLRLEQARRESADAAREEAERLFESRLEQERREWQAAQPSEEDFQKRLEQACVEAAAVARRESEAQIEDLREQLEASRKALTLAVSSAQSAAFEPANFDVIRDAIEEIESQRTQSDTLAALVRRAAQFTPRVVFFVVKSGDAIGWKASGFENGLNDETVKLLAVPTQRQTLLHDALTSFRVASANSDSPGDYSAVLGLYGSPVPELAVAVPLVIRNKAAAVLYADSGTQEESAINTSALESLMRVAGLAIELLPYRRNAEPARASTATAQLASAAAAPTSTLPAEQPAFQAEIAQARPELKRGIKEVSRRTVETDVERVEATSPAAAGLSTAGERVTVELPPQAVPAPPESLHQAEAQLHQPSHIEAEPAAVEAGPEDSGSEAGEEVMEEIKEVVGEPQRFEPAAPPPPPSPPIFAQSPIFGEATPSAPTMPMSNFVAPPAEEPPAPTAPAFSRPSPPVFAQPVEPSRPAQPVMPVPAPASETEQRAHNDARRFARLLVSEIKLYNAAKVNDGRRNYDLYDRLRDEIDRSRKVYDKRVSPAVASRFDYFYDELVQTLAEGDPAKLGKNCPGPVVLASS